MTPLPRPYAADGDDGESPTDQPTDDAIARRAGGGPVRCRAVPRCRRAASCAPPCRCTSRSPQIVRSEPGAPGIESATVALREHRTDGNHPAQCHFARWSDNQAGRPGTPCSEKACDPQRRDRDAGRSTRCFVYDLDGKLKRRCAIHASAGSGQRRSAARLQRRRGLDLLRRPADLRDRQDRRDQIDRGRHDNGI